MKKLMSFIAGFICYSLIAFLFVGWDNMTTHQQLNNAIVESFLKKVTSSSFAGGKFKNYSFNWENSSAPLLSGPEYSSATSANLLTDPQNITTTHTPVDWITKGGWMEDVPWGPSALRHFYDPIGIDNGAMYLTDRSSKLESLLSPVMSWASYTAKDWATHSSNQYSWTKAKSYVIQALKEKDPDQKKQNMALAYRCLGQVMHLIADMGCPPHVRNDSHPPNVYCLAGDPDPTETLTSTLDAASYVTARAPNSNLASLLANSEQVGKLFDNLAFYVNGHYFSTETISTTRFKPIVRPNNPYPNPYLTDADYNYSNHTYYKIYDNDSVKMCKDLHPVPPFVSWFTTKDSIRGIPYIDMECVQSQIAKIMPNIAETGINLIRLFIPSLEVDITEAKADSGGIVRGKIYYTIPSLSDEYSGLFDLANTYNGDVSFYVNGTKISTIATAAGNVFELKLHGRAKKDRILE